MRRRQLLQAAWAVPFARDALAAESFPSQALRIIVSWAAGGGPDVQARQISEVLSRLLEQTVLIENKVGAAGIVGAQHVAHAKADGYTSLYAANTHLIQKVLQPAAPYDPLADFRYVSLLGSSPAVMVVRADGPYRTVEDVIRAAKASAGSLNYSSGGVGTSAHLAGATLVSLAGLDMTHVPLRGSVEIVASLVRGDTDFAFPIAATGIPQSRPGGKLRALAVTSTERMEQLPDVPTLKEVLGSELAIQESWFGLWVPKATPDQAVNVLHEACVKGATDADLARTLATAGTTLTASQSPEEFSQFVLEENDKWLEILKLAHLVDG